MVVVFCMCNFCFFGGLMLSLRCVLIFVCYAGFTMAKKRKADESIGGTEKNMTVNTYVTAHHPFMPLCYASISRICRRMLSYSWISVPCWISSVPLFTILWFTGLRSFMTSKPESLLYQAVVGFRWMRQQLAVLLDYPLGVCRSHIALTVALSSPLPLWFSLKIAKPLPHLGFGRYWRKWMTTGILMTHKYRGSQQSSREVKPKFIDSTQGEPENIYKS
jgi:hypothetical protein